MFTGIVESQGTLLRKGGGAGEARLVIEGVLGPEALVLGESIAVDGVCLTVASIVKPGPGPCAFEADASAETLSKTTLGDLAAGARVNLERAVAAGGRLGGHIVSGHVDGVGHIVEKTPLGGSVKVVFEAPPALARYIAPKGSICISGVSLTVNGVSKEAPRFDVVLVPHTRDKTSLDAMPLGTKVNLEVDILARYVARLLEHGGGDDHDHARSDAAWTERLKRAGYL